MTSTSFLRISCNLAGPLIIVGFALGVQSVTSSESPHLDDDHKVCLAADGLY